jgi:hypothetical protein
MNGEPSRWKETGKALGFTGVGGTAGYGAVWYMEFTAAAAVGSGGGLGAAPGPVGAVIGALTGLAAYGVWTILRPRKARS